MAFGLTEDIGVVVIMLDVVVPPPPAEVLFDRVELDEVKIVVDGVVALRSWPRRTRTSWKEGRSS